METQNNTEEQTTQPVNEISNFQNENPISPELPNSPAVAVSLPKKKNFFQKNWLTLALGFVLLLVIAFSVYQAFFANYFKKQYDETNTLYLAEVDKSALLEQELTALNVDKTTLESIKNNLENQNAELDEKATTAEEEASELQGSLSAKTEELQKKAAELTTMNSNLAAKKAELDKAQRGVAKFTEVEKLYTSFKTKSDEFIVHTGNSINYIVKYINTGNEDYVYAASDELDAADVIYSEMEKLNIQMNVVFDEIKAGSY